MADEIKQIDSEKAKRLVEKAKDLFEKNKVDRIYLTSDGTGFVGKNDTLRHGRSLEDKTVVYSDRSDFTKKTKK